MCNLSDRIEERGIKKGVEIGERNGILKLIKKKMNEGLSPVNAMKLLGIEENEFPIYLNLLNN